MISNQNILCLSFFSQIQFSTDLLTLLMAGFCFLVKATIMHFIHNLCKQILVKNYYLSKEKSYQRNLENSAKIPNIIMYKENFRSFICKYKTFINFMEIHPTYGIR